MLFQLFLMYQIHCMHPLKSKRKVLTDRRYIQETGPAVMSLKFYDDEIPCKQANLLVTDLLVLSVTVVNACVISGYILSNFKQFTDLD
ncbi:hypothetical protein LSH36_16g10009 [Paralvinella palmiformis]|uniref:Uncharacterized protein n=1 Tax=Paralvinella palmiformis TaxID=53620 RepID=A0AAD9KD68_9ANNE|nr:hypothetical protein LSH36_16g10009 [Paralvinella palmiformis]